MDFLKCPISFHYFIRKKKLYYHAVLSYSTQYLIKYSNSYGKEELELLQLEQTVKQLLKSE